LDGTELCRRNAKLCRARRGPGGLKRCPHGAPAAWPERQKTCAPRCDTTGGVAGQSMGRARLPRQSEGRRHGHGARRRRRHVHGRTSMTAHPWLCIRGKTRTRGPMRIMGRREPLVGLGSAAPVFARSIAHAPVGRCALLVGHRAMHRYPRRQAGPGQSRVRASARLAPDQATCVQVPSGLRQAVPRMDCGRPSIQTRCTKSRHCWLPRE
jgi:hypothetical protein